MPKDYEIVFVYDGANFNGNKEKFMLLPYKITKLEKEKELIIHMNIANTTYNEILIDYKIVPIEIDLEKGVKDA